MTLRSTSLLLLTALAITGCKHEAAPKNVETVQSSPGPTVDPATAGSITGVVHFEGKAPARVPIDMSMDPACAFSKDPNLSEQFVVTGGKLGNVFVYVKSGIAPSQAPAGTPAVVLDQKGCRYLPHVVAVQQGGSVEFRNSDPTMHNIHTMPSTVGNEGVDISQAPMGQPQTHQFKSPETMLPVRCNNHPWMNAFVNVAPNPYFAVSGTDGSFTIQGLPPGNYTLAAVHEKLGEQDIQITVAPKATASASFAFTPK
ncbi:carboxypeptidase regulatory-like domain-containing protein [Granulicella sp. S156]|uniref:carboxypeptidase regulatory-like domain-containing protein n=1 Tax=Granulicella sp. S156 TaxID=1747224 RepID=UPI00131B370A|nr:carboxypeptidase regulatory-like domain-containing protein [Granulicella sp. S156]